MNNHSTFLLPLIAMKLLYEKDAPLTPLGQKTVAVVGYGNQGHAHALNLRDSGLSVLVANRTGTEGFRRAEEAGFAPISFIEAAQRADLLIFALPDEVQPEVHETHVAAHLREGQCLGFIHGFNIHFNLIRPPADVDVVMVAPKGPGSALRLQFEAGRGLPCLVAVGQDATGNALDIALAWASGIGGARAGILQSTFARECVTDLFGEQAVLCGGMIELMKAGVETLIDAGYPPEMAYFECVHEVKLIVDLVCQQGIEGMRQRISTTARYGGLTQGPRVVGDEARRAMKALLSDVESGAFARRWREEYLAGMSRLRQLEGEEAAHAAVRAGQSLRNLLPLPELQHP